MFTVTGVINGETEQLTYEMLDGKGSVSGDEMAMFMFRTALERKTSIGPVGQYLDRNINEPLSALFMMIECFDEIIECSGEVPEADEIPEGAIG